MEIVYVRVHQDFPELPEKILFFNMPKAGERAVIVRFLGPLRTAKVHVIPFAFSGWTRPCHGEAKTCPHCKNDNGKFKLNGYIAAEVLVINEDRKRVWRKVIFSVPATSIPLFEGDRISTGTVYRVERVFRGKLHIERHRNSSIVPNADAPVHEPFNVYQKLLDHWFPNGIPESFRVERMPDEIDRELDARYGAQAATPDSNLKANQAVVFEKLGVNSIEGLLELLARPTREPQLPSPTSETKPAVETVRQDTLERIAWHGSSIQAFDNRRLVNAACERVGLPIWLAMNDMTTERGLTLADHEQLARTLELRGEPAAAKIVADVGRRRFSLPHPDSTEPPRETGLRSDPVESGSRTPVVNPFPSPRLPVGIEGTGSLRPDSRGPALPANAPPAAPVERAIRETQGVVKRGLGWKRLRDLGRAGPRASAARILTAGLFPNP